MSANLYSKFLVNALAADINITSDTIKMALMTGTYTPNLTTDNHWSDIHTHEVSGIAGSGYTEGGATLTSVSLTLTAANSWGTSWAGTTSYNYGQVVIPTAPNGYLYRCVQAGTTGSSEPSWPTTPGLVVTDSGVIWACMGADILVFTSATPTWTGATFTVDYAVIYDAESGTYSSEPLIALQTFSSPQSPVSQTYEVIPDPVLGWFYLSPPS